jgi:pseudaminic acid biosynthesis-associated methylase
MAEALLDAVAPPSVPAGLRLRPAHPGDCERVWQLNNEAGARAASRSPEPIAPADHDGWFAARLADPDTLLAIVELDGRPAGVIRIERRAGAAELSLAVDPAERGRGLGRAAVRAAAEAAAARWPTAALEAWVADDNRASIRCFESAGFAEAGGRRIGDRWFRRYRRPRRRESMSAATDPLALWRSEFGRDYTERNDREMPGRQSAWRDMVGDLPMASALEVGSNVGWNLTYLSRLGTYRLVGIEPQPDVVRRGRRRSDAFALLEGDAFDLPFKDRSFDLVFTSGVLIHIRPRDLPRALAEIDRVSRRYVLYVEYDHPSEVEVPYRGRAGALWKRDHRAAWRAAAPHLVPVRGGLWGRERDYDDCSWCLFEKR